MAIVVLLHTGCDKIEDNKDKVPSLPTVDNLAFSISNGVANVTWSIPSNIPGSFARPLGVSIQVYQYRPATYNPVRLELETLESEVTSYSYTVPTDGNDYHIIVKLIGNITNPPYGTSPTVYSLGQTVIVKL